LQWLPRLSQSSISSYGHSHSSHDSLWD